MKAKVTSKILKGIYQRLFVFFGPQHWWPALTPFEVIVGAILTQNTSWKNVEKAIKNLKEAKLLSPTALKKVNIKRLAGLIRPSGYYNQKAKKLKNFISFLYSHYQGSLKEMFKEDFYKLREELMQVNGIGPETADSILLYAAGYPVFVVDAYTKRIFSRHNLIDERFDYNQTQGIFMENLKSDSGFFNEYHALIVKLGKDICKARPNCSLCPLNKITRDGK